MLKNILATIQVEREYYDTKTFESRFSSTEAINNYINEENKDDEVKYSLISYKEMTEADLDQWLIDEKNRYSDKFIRIHKISNLQIVEYISTYEGKNETKFQAYREYERVTNWIFNTLEECLLNALVNKNLEVNEAHYAHDLIKRMIKWE